MDTREKEVKVPRRILTSLLTSLEAGVVPRSGAPYIAIGREQEIASLLSNLAAVEEGGAFVRFLIGRYGSGKSFLIQLIRGYALERDFLCADADLSPERRLSGGNGCGLATYRELMRNLASKACPDGGAMPVILSRYYAALRSQLVSEGFAPESEEYTQQLQKRIVALLSQLEGSVGGFDFARVLSEYYAATLREDTECRTACLRWLRGEFANKTEARRALGFQVSTVIADENWYDFLKLWALLSKHMGYRGFIVYVDECVNLYKISNRISRESNYEKLLAIFNDTLQGRASYFGVIFGGTPQFLEDPRRGLFSYEALKSRLEDSRYTALGYETTSAPVIRLRRLSDNDLLALLARLSRLFAQLEGGEERVSEEDLLAFLQVQLQRAGADVMVTPREIIRDFLTVLNILREHPALHFGELIADFAGREGADASSKSEDPGRSGTIDIADFDF